MQTLAVLADAQVYQKKNLNHLIKSSGLNNYIIYTYAT